MTNPLLLVSVPHKDGWFQKIWSPSIITISWMVTKVFSIAIKWGMPHVYLRTFWWLSTRTFQKIWQPPLFWQLKQFNRHSKNSDGRMATKIFWSPHLVPFWSCPYGDWKYFSHHKDGQLKEFGWSPLWWPKNFRLWTLQWLKFFGSPFLVVIETFRLPQKGGASYVFV